MDASRTSGPNPSSDAVKQTLKWIRKNSFKPVALHKQSKAARDAQFADPHYVPPGDELWQINDLGIGVVTGPSHSGPVDIDIDCEEAAFFAERFLPPTKAIFGRMTKPRSHYLYRVDVDALPKKAYIDPLAKSTIIEMRADGGHQTVMPGSIHETTGEQIVWSEIAFPEVTHVSFEVLDFAVKKIAIAVLILRHMWADGQRNEVNKHLAGMFYYMGWSEEETQSLIRAVMDYAGDDDATRLRTVAITYKKGEKGGRVTGSNTLRSFLGDPRLVDRILEWAGSEAAALLQDYNERFAVVSIEGKFRVAETTPLKRGEPPTLYSKEDFINVMMPDKIENAEGKMVPKAYIWLNDNRRREYRSMDYIPGEEDASPVLNLWTGWAVDPDPEKKCEAWLDLLHNTICGGNDETFRWMLHWFANIVREPTKKSLTAPVIVGVQGAGKSLMMGYFGEILGAGYTTITNEEHIYGRFNKHLATTLLLHSEEALFGGDRKHRGIIKSLITDSYRIFEPKGIDAKQVKNYLRLAMTSNEIWAAPAEARDRRFTIIDMEGRKASTATIKGVLHELDNGGPAGLFHHLKTMEYDPMVPRTNIKNSSLLSLKQINFDPIATWWYETLRMGQLLPDYLAWAAKPAGDDWPPLVAAGALNVALALSLRERNVRQSASPSQTTAALNKMMGGKLGRSHQHVFRNPMSDDAPKEVKLMSPKQYTYVIPSLEECRKAFDAYVGQDMEWPQQAEPEQKEPHDNF